MEKSQIIDVLRCPYLYTSEQRRTAAKKAAELLDSAAGAIDLTTKMSYIATDPVTGKCYATCYADPDFIADTAEEIGRWKMDGALIALLPRKEAVRRFIEG